MNINFDIEKVMLDVEKNIDNFFKNDFPQFFETLGIESLSKYSYPKVNVEAYKNHYLLVAEMGASFNKEDVNVQVKDNYLTISGTCANKRDLSQVEKFILREIKQSNFSRSFRLTNVDQIDLTKVSADLKDGWLIVTLPKKGSEKPTATKIPIN